MTVLYSCVNYCLQVPSARGTAPFDQLQLPNWPMGSRLYHGRGLYLQTTLSWGQRSGWDLQDMLHSGNSNEGRRCIKLGHMHQIYSTLGFCAPPLHVVLKWSSPSYMRLSSRSQGFVCPSLPPPPSVILLVDICPPLEQNPEIALYVPLCRGIYPKMTSTDKCVI